jgi:hypothetical protein
MAQYGLIRRLWLTRLSQPVGERAIYRHILRSPPKRIMEIGVGTLVRTERLLGLAGSRATDGPLHYVGLDRFEGRQPTDPPGVSLKQAHQRLHALARVQLVPGNTDASLSRLCNHLGVFDLVLISGDNDQRHLDRSWFFIQRVTNARSTILVESPVAGGKSSAWKPLEKSRLDEFASRMILRRAG